MSLINQMLSDLEARRGGSVRNVDHALDGLQSAGGATRARRRRSLRIALGLGLLLIVVGGLLWKFRLAPPAASPQVAIPANAPTTAGPASAAVTPAPAAPAVVLPAAAPVPAPVPAAQPVILADVQASAAPAEQAPAALAAEPAPVTAPAPPAPGPEVAPAPVTPPVASSKPPGENKAPRDLAAAATPEPGQEPVVERPGSFHRSVATTLPATDVAAYAAATQRLSLGSTAEMNAFIATHPTRVDAREQLALNLIERGHGAEAEALLQEGLKLLPNQTRLAEVLGHALVDRGDPAAALRVLRPAAPPIAANPDFHALLAAAEQSTGANALAATRYRGLLQLQPTNGRWWIGLGISVRALGDPKTATLAFQRALDDRSLPEPLRDYASREAVRLKEH